MVTGWCLISEVYPATHVAGDATFLSDNPLHICITDICIFCLILKYILQTEAQRMERRRQRKANKLKDVFSPSFTKISRKEDHRLSSEAAKANFEKWHIYGLQYRGLHNMSLFSYSAGKHLKSVSFLTKANENIKKIKRA